MFDLKIVNARIPDFGANCFKTADIGIKDGKIACVGSSIADATETLDAAGKVVSPGFIDIHMHEETLDANLADPYFSAYYSLRMGATTCVCGCCGDNRQDIADFKAYINKNGAPVNYLTSLGYNFLRDKAGVEDRYRPATADEIEKIKTYIAEYEKYGFLGISYGIEYTPGSTQEEMTEVTKALSSENYLLSAHYRTDEKKCVEALEEMAAISRESGFPMQVSHIGSGAAMGYMEIFLARLDALINEGYDLTADSYPYSAFATRIGTAVFDEGCFERWDKTYSDILLTQDPYKNVRCDKELFYKVREEYPNMVAVAFVMQEPEVVMAYQSPHVFVASDSLFSGSSGHPRGAGTFPRVLSRYVRQEKALDLLVALRKMTKDPAQRLKLNAKGEIAEGFDADIVVFDPDTIEDIADFEHPTLPPKGIDTIIVGGKLAVRNNDVVNGRLGQYVDYGALFA